MHDFCVTSFLSPTYCELCGGFLWGLARQGVQCRKCRSTAHKNCVLGTHTKCVGDRGLATLVAGPSSRSTSGCARDSGADDTHDQQLDAVFWEQVHEETEINKLISRQADQPLSLFQTLPANFMQFTAKLAPLSLVHRGATDIVLWRRPRNSLAAMAVYTLYCLRPHLLLATPLALAIAYMLYGFYHCQGAGQGAGAAATARARALPSPPGWSLGAGRAARVSPPADQSSSASSSASPEAASPSMSRRHARRSRIVGRRRSASQSSTHSDSRAAAAAADMGVVAPDVSIGNEAASAGMRRRSDGSGGGAHAARASHAAAGVAGASGGADVGALLGVAGFGSAKYTQNVHTTQTLTGTYVGVYDWVAAHHCLVDWSQPAEAQRILAACVCAQAAVLVVAYVVAPRILFMAGGNLGMLAMSPHVRAFAKVYGAELALDLQAWTAVRLAGVRRSAARAAAICRRGARRRLPAAAAVFASPALLAQESSDDDDDGAGGSGYRTPPALLSLSSTAGSGVSTLGRRVQIVSVFENQRWWLGLGWVPRLGSSERSKWSDKSGQRKFASIRDFLPEDGYEWASVHDGWEIDRHWALPVRTDAEGWVYSDNSWRRWASAPSVVSSYTRRRHWIRRVRPISSTGDPSHVPLR
ncbi:hypothetical protein H4R19_004512 [Coemansia spiralis]|nr:hypothetical protein H4R19_004512 [Coemansia spiralis]